MTLPEQTDSDGVYLNRQLRRALARAKKHNTDFSSSGGVRTGFARGGTMQNRDNVESANRQLRKGRRS
jgi:hypothetical protein